MNGVEKETVGMFVAVFTCIVPGLIVIGQFLLSREANLSSKELNESYAEEKLRLRNEINFGLAKEVTSKVIASRRLKPPSGNIFSRFFRR